jgi:hypothetical protein
VDLAVELAFQFTEETRSALMSSVRNSAERHLPCELVRRWRKEVSAHCAQSPFTSEELERLERNCGAATRQSATRDAGMFVAYGTTLLLVIVADRYDAYLQLGDGDIVAVSEKTGCAYRPLPPDGELIANETTSLCMDNAHRLFRCRFQAAGEDHPDHPSAILASTDGYSNSFASDEDFMRVGTDIMAIARRDGWPSVEANLPSWLSGASATGSGDDITLGIIARDKLQTSSNALCDPPDRDVPACGLIGTGTVVADGEAQS